MRYITFTHVDVLTGIPVTVEPARNGPSMPAGSVFGFALESLYPTSTPTFYGTTTGRTDLPGILSTLTKAEYDEAQTAELAARAAKAIASASRAVTAERDRRIALPFEFEGHLFQSDSESRQRINTSRGSAMAAAMAGAQPGDLRWTGLPVDFFWIAEDNTRVPMDAPTMVRLGNASAANEGLHIVAANDLKKRIEAGEVIADIGDDALWP